MEVLEEGLDRLSEHALIPIRFDVVSRLDVASLVTTGQIEEVPVTPYVKDYDLDESSRPANLPAQFDTAHWALISSFEGGQRTGGAVLAWNSPDFDMLEGRSDVAVLVDLRVAPGARGRGTGRALFLASEEWARRRGCSVLVVETQDTNVPACRFYTAMGCSIRRVESPGYPGFSDEAKIVWQRQL